MHKVVNGVVVEMTQEEVDARLAEEAKYEEERQLYIRTVKYIDDRSAAYPPIGDQLDAILKQFDMMRADGLNMDVGMNNIIEQWLAVKSQYPKPIEVVKQ